jgi:hypothetical protein
MAAVTGSRSAEGRADDPRGGPPFGVVVWKNEAGQTCAALGRRVGERVTDPSGMHDYPIEEGGGCVDLASMPGDLDVRQSGEHGLGDSSVFNPVTVVWGLAKAGISQVQVRTERGVRTAKVTARGAFVLTLPGAMISAFDIAATTPTELRKTTTFPPASAEIRDRILHPRTGEEVRREIEQQLRRSSR